MAYLPYQMQTLHRHDLIFLNEVVAFPVHHV